MSHHDSQEGGTLDTREKLFEYCVRQLPALKRARRRTNDPTLGKLIKAIETVNQQLGKGTTDSADLHNPDDN
ncbi:MAG: hypothetical protein RLZZ387_5069 [Chloroflexota bacterium]|jgi:hypothetical protein